MLSSLRGALQGWVAWVVVALLVLAFTFFGVPDLRNFAQGSPLQVGQTKFSTLNIRKEFDRQLDVLRRQTGQQLTTQEALNFGLLNRTIGALSYRASIKQDATNLGLTASTEMVGDFLQSNPAYENPNTGKFDQAVLTNILQNNNLGLVEFKNLIRDELVQEQLISAIGAPTDVATPFVAQFALRQVEQRQIDYLIVTADQAAPVPEPTEENLQTWYNENTDTYTAPEYRTFRIVTLKAENMREGLAIDEQELRTLYELRKDQLDRPETRSFQQLTLPTEAQAAEVAKNLTQGSAFEELAKQQNLSVEAATSTDKQKPQIADATLAEAIFSLKEEGDVTSPIKSLFGGYTVAQLLSVTQGQQTTFEEQREALEATSLQEETTRRMLDTIEQIETARDEGATVEEAVEGIEQTRMASFGPVDNTLMTPGGAITDNLSSEMLAEAFALQLGDESDLLEIQDEDGYFLVILDDVISPRLKDFDLVKDDVKTSWRVDQRRKNIRTAAEVLERKIAEGLSLKEAAAEASYELQSAETGRFDQRAGLPETLLQKVFIADLGALVSDPQPVTDNIYLATPISAEFPPSLQGGLLINLYRDSAKEQLATELREAYLSSLQQELGIKRNEVKLSQIFSQDQ